MKGLHLHLLLVTMTAVASISAAEPLSEAALAQECSQDFQKVTLCLEFATGKAPNPSKQCCDAVEATKERDPKCLCFVIQQSKKGGKALKDLGVQDDKLIQLPTFCKLHNASISDCPKLLGIPPSSPDAAVFTSNATSTTSPTAPSGTKSPATQASAEKGGSASVRVDHALVALTVALIAFSSLSLP